MSYEQGNILINNTNKKESKMQEPKNLTLKVVNISMDGMAGTSTVFKGRMKLSEAVKIPISLKRNVRTGHLSAKKPIKLYSDIVQELVDSPDLYRVKTSPFLFSASKCRIVNGQSFRAENIAISDGAQRADSTINILKDEIPEGAEIDFRIIVDNEEDPLRKVTLTVNTSKAPTAVSLANYAGIYDKLIDKCEHGNIDLFTQENQESRDIGMYDYDVKHLLKDMFMIAPEPLFSEKKSSVFKKAVIGAFTRLHKVDNENAKARIKFIESQCVKVINIHREIRSDKSTSRWHSSTLNARDNMDGSILVPHSLTLIIMAYMSKFWALKNGRWVLDIPIKFTSAAALKLLKETHTRWKRVIAKDVINQMARGVEINTRDGNFNAFEFFERLMNRYLAK